MSRMLLSPLLLVLASTSVVCAEKNDWYEVANDWSGVAKSLLGLFFVYAGVSLLLYNHIATHKIWKKYTNERFSTKVSGDVLSSERSSIDYNKFDVSVLYVAVVHKFENDPRNKFRYPNAYEEKRFMRTFLVGQPISRGTVLDVFILRGMARSGCIREVVEKNTRAHSHCRTVMILVPGVALISLFVYLAVMEVSAMQDQTVGWIVLAVGLLVILMGTNMWCQRRFHRELGRTFQVAVPQKIVSSRHHGQRSIRNDRSEPLLDSDNSSIVQSRGHLHKKGMHVLYKSSGTTTEARILDVHMDDSLEPYYTIQCNDGREKQTDNGHILPV